MSSVPGMIRILAVDDHALLRKGVAATINAELDMKLVAEASNGEEAIEKFRTHRPDVTLMDLQMPGLNGIDPKILEAGGTSGHFGIPGMRERAQRIGSRLDFWSETGAGTEVQLTIPAAIAYGKRSHQRRFRLFPQGRSR